MGRALKLFFRIAILAVLGLIVYAMVAELPAPQREVERELPLPGPTGQ